jgi:hypothetical protein
MDDAANTNLLKFPFVGIIGIDERNCNQLLAFALICDRTTESFRGFLEWIREQLPAPVNREDPVPRAFMVDRHQGQFAAITLVYPLSAIFFCALHLESNIKEKFPQNTELLDQFWAAARAEIGVVAWQNYLLTCMTKANAKQLTLLQTLHDECGRYCGELVDHVTTLEVSSRAEGTFGNYRVSEGHRPGTLAHTAQAFMDFGDKWRIEQARPANQRRKLFVDEEFLSRTDQLRLGPNIGSRLAEEVEKSRHSLPEYNEFDIDAVQSRSCCRVAAKWGLPCVHLITSRMLSSPRLKLSDFPERWRIPEGSLAAARGAPPPEMGPIRETRSLSAERESTEWNYHTGLAIVEPILNALHNTPWARQIVVDLRNSFDAGPEPQTGSQRDSGSGLHDPARPAAPGSQVSHPAYSSGIALTRGRRIRLRRTRGTKKRVQRCGYCGKTGHNRRTCQKRLADEENGEPRGQIH